MMDVVKNWWNLTRKFLEKMRRDGSVEKDSCFIEAAAVSHQGKIRENNEDNLYFQGRFLPVDHWGTKEIWNSSGEKKLTAAVFDGIGGEAAGELASYAAAQEMNRYLTSEGKNAGNGEKIIGPGEINTLCISLNRKVVEAARQGKYTQIGTTAVMAFLNEEKYLICNLGDSPAYLFRNGALSLLTNPHTNARFLKNQGISGIKPGLTQFLGIDEGELMLEPYLVQGDLEPDDQLLLCSDGLTDMVPEEQITYILKKKLTISSCVEQLVHAALDQGGRDNITIVLCRIVREDTEDNG